MIEQCDQCNFFKDDSDGTDPGCYIEPKPIYRKPTDPACVRAEPVKEKINCLKCNDTGKYMEEHDGGAAEVFCDCEIGVKLEEQGCLVCGREWAECICND